MRSEEHEFHTIVVGAGASGIAAALQLSNAKVPYLVLEARHRIGGRALTK